MIKYYVCKYEYSDQVTDIILDDRETAEKYCKIANEPYNYKLYYIEENDVSSEDWNEKYVTRYLNVVIDNDDKFETFGIVNITKEVIMDSRKEKIEEDDYGEFGDNEWIFNCNIIVDSFDNYSMEYIKNEAYRRLNKIKESK